MVLFKGITRAVPLKMITTVMPLRTITTVMPLRTITTVMPLRMTTTVMPLRTITTIMPLRKITTAMPLRKFTTAMPLRKFTSSVRTMPLTKDWHICNCICNKQAMNVLNAKLQTQVWTLRTMSFNLTSINQSSSDIKGNGNVYSKSYLMDVDYSKKCFSTKMLAPLQNITLRSNQQPPIRWHSTRSDAHTQKSVLNATTPKIILDTSVNNAVITEKSFRNEIDPYLKLMRLDKPIGIYLLFWPCAWSLTLGAAAAGSAPSSIAHMFILFGAGSVVMRAAGTTLNDILDQDIDKQVERTKSRPLVTGAVTRRQAIAFLAAELSVGLAILLQLNWYSVMIGASSMLLVTTYPLAKRITNYPQVVLGATFNYGAVIGYCAMANQLDLMLVPLYLGGVVWTTLYDTVYALQDKADDARIGVKSTALTFAGNTKPALYTCASLMGALWTAAGALGSLDSPYYVGVAAATAHAVRQIYTLKMDDPDDCAKKFRSNTWIGVLMFLGIIGGTYSQYLANRQKGGLEGSDLQASRN